MVERCPEKAGVGSSILPLGTIFVGGDASAALLTSRLASAPPATKMSSTPGRIEESRGGWPTGIALEGRVG